jgi:Protein of unknown function (DUF3995)
VTDTRPGMARFAHLACAWGLLFAALHYYWALGGRIGLDVSAGRRLADTRPLWFVLTGLWGVGTACLGGAVLGILLARDGLRTRLGRRLGGSRAGWLLCLMGWGVGGLLLMRAVAVEVMLLTGAGDLDTSLGRHQVFWTLVLWNPWFALGGLAFAAAAHQARPGRSA